MLQVHQSLGLPLAALLLLAATLLLLSPQAWGRVSACVCASAGVSACGRAAAHACVRLRKCAYTRARAPARGLRASAPARLRACLHDCVARA